MMDMPRGKWTGVVRKVDELGRLVIPKELRTSLGWDFHTPIEFYATESGIFLVPYRSGCVFCSSITDRMYLHKEKQICEDCLKEFQTRQAEVKQKSQILFNFRGEE